MSNSSPVRDLLAVGLAHHQAGRLADAERSYQQVLTASPDQPDALHLLGVLYHQVQSLPQAVELLSRSVAIAPTAVALGNLGQALIDSGRPAEAERALKRSIHLDPNRPDIHVRLCVALHQQRDGYGAVEAGRRATELAPEHSEAWSHLATALAMLKKYDEAAAAAERSIAISPARVEPYIALASVHEAAGRRAAAETVLKRSIEVCETYPLGHRNLAALHDRANNPALAIAPLKRALELNPRDVEGWNNLSALHRRTGDVDAALAAANHALKLVPNHASAHGNRGLALLTLGSYLDGFAEYEWRWRCDNFTTAPRDFGRPLWDGSDPSGRSIFVHTEQGFGDVIQFVRYVPMLADRGATVILECTQPLRALLSSVRGVSRVVVSGVRPPDFDLHVPLLSLPRLFGTTLETVPHSVPYLAVDQERMANWKNCISTAGAGLRVGIVWAGNPKPDPARTCPVNCLSAVSEVAGVTFFSLQRREDLRDGQKWQDPRLVSLADDIREFADTAAAMVNLDLIISIDTAAAHLAGALGRPAWTLLPANADWRWLQNRDDSPWYPTMRLFRQRAPGNWDELMGRVAQALQGLIRSRV